MCDVAATLGGKRHVYRLNVRTRGVSHTSRIVIDVAQAADGVFFTLSARTVNNFMWNNLRFCQYTSILQYNSSAKFRHLKIWTIRYVGASWVRFIGLSRNQLGSKLVYFITKLTLLFVLMFASFSAILKSNMLTCTCCKNLHFRIQLFEANVAMPLVD